MSTGVIRGLAGEEQRLQRVGGRDRIKSTDRKLLISSALLYRQEEGGGGAVGDEGKQH